MENRKLILAIAGGGASGLMAAVSASRILPGKEIGIIEKNKMLGRKLAATGNGKCNFSNRDCSPAQYGGGNPELLRAVLKQMTPEDTISFLEGLGVFAREDREGRLYPYSEQASSVKEAFEAELFGRKAVTFLGKTVTMAEKKGGRFLIRLDDGSSIFSDKLILATGGKAGSAYGADGSGYQLAKSFGHTLVSPLPALVQLTADEKSFKELKGVRAKGRVTLYKDKKAIASEIGEIQFVEDGLSGICIFDLSRYCRTEAGETLTVQIDLFPEYNEKALAEKLTVRRDCLAARRAGDFLAGMMNKKLIPGYLKRWGVDQKLPLSALSFAEIRKLAEVLKSWNVEISGTKGWADAQVTSGGVCTSEINSETLESKLVAGLYFAGELLDVDGTCGGRNLQWAFSSGFVAGRNAVMKDTI